MRAKRENERHVDAPGRKRTPQYLQRDRRQMFHVKHPFA